MIASRGHQEIEPYRGLLRGITGHHDLIGLQWDWRGDPFLGNRPAPSVKSPAPTALRIRLPDQDRHRDPLIHQGCGPPAGGLRKIRDAGDHQRLGFTGRSFPRLDPRLVGVPERVPLEFVQVSAVEGGDFLPAILVLGADLRDARQQRSDPTLRQQVAEIAHHARGTQKGLLPLEHLTLREEMLHRGTWSLLQHQTPRSLTIRSGGQWSLRQERLHR